MTRRSSSPRGVLILMRHGIRRAWLVSAVVGALGALPALRAEASIVTAGNVDPPLNVSSGDWTLTWGMNVGRDLVNPGVLTVDGGSTLWIPNDNQGLAIGGLPPTLLEPDRSGTGTVYIDGSGSSIAITGRGAWTNVGRWGATSTGALSITNAGNLTSTFFSVGVGDQGTPYVDDGVNGATGTVIADGPGSSITLSGFNVDGYAAGGVIGRDGGTGSVTLRNQATLSLASPGAWYTSGGFDVGRSGGSGTFTLQTGAAMLIDGTGTTGSITPGMAIGREGGTGTLTVESGASLTIKPNSNGGGITVAYTTGSTGTMVVDGAGTQVVLDGTAPGARPGMSLGWGAGSHGTLEIKNGAELTFNRGLTSERCCMTVGRQGHGVLRITGGGRLTINDESGFGVPEVGLSVGIGFGGTWGIGAGGTFEALVTGPGSALTINAIADGLMAIGLEPGSDGTMTVENGATVSVDHVNVGRNAGSRGTFNVSGASMSLVGDAAGFYGAGLVVGLAGEGHMNVTGGSVITIDGTATADLSGIYVGGARLWASGGTGVLTVSGGSVITAQGQDVGFTVGFDATGGSQPSTGTATVDSGGQILLAANGRSSIGSTPGSTGTVTVAGGGSLVDAGAFLGIGRDRDGNLGGTGTLTVSEGGTLRATQINCGAGGTINGDGGILIGEVIADPACVISPGLSPGTLSIIGSLSTLGARIVLEVDAFGNHDVLAVEGTTSFDPATQVEVRVDPAFRPPVGAVTLELVQVQADPGSQTQPLLTLIVPESGVATVQVEGDFTRLSAPPTVVSAPVPTAPGMVQIDIKPGSSPNTVNLGSAGAIPVAILSSPAFDALTVDPLTIRLDGAAVKLVGKGQRPLCSAEDVNGDGRPDLLCHVVTSQLPAEGDGIATLRAQTFRTLSSPGMAVQGSDFIRIVP